MIPKKKHTGSIIILAWPQSPARAIGRWYDHITKLLGFLKNGYYKAGHAAAVLVNHQTRELKYFDFGRYHTPRLYGRVRDEITDPGLKLKNKAIFSNEGNLINLKKIMQELYENDECHGKGILYASVLEKIDFTSAEKFAKDLQNKDLVSYGPYAPGGSNCSRFIASLAIAGSPQQKIRLRLKLHLLLTPFPKGNVVVGNRVYFSYSENGFQKHYVKFTDYLKNFTIPRFHLFEKGKKHQNKTFKLENKVVINDLKSYG